MTSELETPRDRYKSTNQMSFYPRLTFLLLTFILHILLASLDHLLYNQHDQLEDFSRFSRQQQPGRTVVTTEILQIHYYDIGIIETINTAS